MKFIVQDPVRHNQKGFADLASLYAQTKDCFFDNIEFDMQSTRWFDADMCAVFGAVLYRLGVNLNAVRLTDIPSQIGQIFSRNGFLSHYGRDRISDFWSTTIPYQRFDIEDDRYFSNYIEKGLVNRQEFPNMSSGLHKQFRQSILEIFNNAVVHSQSDLGVFSCGQFFPHRNRLVFGVVDLGAGIREYVSRYLNMEISPEKTIDWATQDNNTKRNASIPGGLGLKPLR